MKTPSSIPNLDEQLQRLLDGHLSEHEQAVLEHHIMHDPEMRDYYIQTMLTSAALRRSSLVTGDIEQTDLIKAVSRRWTLKRIGMAIAAMITLLLSGWFGVHRTLQAKRGLALGHVASQNQAVWSPRIKTGSTVHAGPYTLLRGTAQVTLSKGSQVSLQAPCQVEWINGNEMILTQGKVMVDVPAQAKGFKIHTQNRVLTDLGTQFGVITDANTLETHVFKGVVMVTPEPKLRSTTKPVTLKTGQAITVTPTSQIEHEAQAKRFIMSPAPNPGPAAPGVAISLADIITEGSGYGPSLTEHGIDVCNGVGIERTTPYTRTARHASFVPTPQFRYIDGVFVPNGLYNLMRISTTGLKFPTCPSTDNTYYEGVMNSVRQICKADPDIHYPIQLKGIQYGTPERPGFNIHPNAGITFDLDAIRQDNPGVAIESLTGVCGISETSPKSRMSAADFWVLLDGELVSHFHWPKTDKTAQDLDITIPDDIRFLTLVTTCSSDTNYSWVVLGEPLLKLRSKTRL